PAREIARSRAVIDRVGRDHDAVAPDGVEGAPVERIEAGAAEIGGKHGRRTPRWNGKVDRSQCRRSQWILDAGDMELVVRDGADKVAALRSAKVMRSPRSGEVDRHRGIEQVVECGRAAGQQWGLVEGTILDADEDRSGGVVKVGAEINRLL